MQKFWQKIFCKGNALIAVKHKKFIVFGLQFHPKSIVGAMKKENKKNVFLLGFMGTGKSIVGKMLAKKLGMNFIDADEEIEKKSKKSIKRIFADFGEEHFRELEIKAIKFMCNKNNCVIAVGGGAVLNYLNVVRMQKNGVVVLLQAEPKTILKRVGKEKNRPLLFGNDKQKVKRIKELLRFRKPFYDAAKKFEIKTDGKSVQQIVREIMKKL